MDEDQLLFQRFDRSAFGLPPRYRARFVGKFGWSFERSEKAIDQTLESKTIKTIKQMFPSAMCRESVIGYDKLFMNEADWAVLEMLCERRVDKKSY